MGLRFRKIFRLAPGVRLNLSKSGASVSLGQKGATVNIGGKGVRETVGLPGSGLSYSEFQSYKGSKKSGAPVIGIVLLVIIVAILAFKTFG